MNNLQETLGVDLGGTKVRVARINAEGKILEKVIDYMPEGKDAQIAAILQNIKRLLSEKVIGIGIGFPGRVRNNDGMVLTAGYLHEMNNTPVAELINETLGVPVFMDTDSNMALFAEYKLGAACGIQNVIMLTIGTGIGGAIILDGKIFYRNGNGAQLGHITIDPSGPVCNCGRRGCIETLSSGTSLRRILSTTYFKKNMSIKELLLLAQKGDSKAWNVLSQWVSPLKMAVDSLYAVLAPDVVLLGGGLGTAAYEALELIRPTGSTWFATLVKPGILGDDAGVIGSGLSAWEKYGNTVK